MSGHVEAAMLDASWQPHRRTQVKEGQAGGFKLCVLSHLPPPPPGTPPPTSLSASLVQAPAAEALDAASLDGLNKRLNTLEAAAKDKLVEQVKQYFACCASCS